MACCNTYMLMLLLLLLVVAGNVMVQGEATARKAVTYSSSTWREKRSSCRQQTVAMKVLSATMTALFLLVASSFAPSALAFMPSSYRLSPRHVQVGGGRPGAGCAQQGILVRTLKVNALSMSSSSEISEGRGGEGGGGGDVTSASKRRRRKRKDGRNVKAEQNAAYEVEAEPASSVVEEDSSPAQRAEQSEPAPAAASKKNEVVTMKVRDVRDILSGKPEQTASVVRSEGEYDEDDDELADDEEWEYYYEDDSEGEASSVAGGDSSLEQLLADARKMRTEASSSGGEIGSADAKGGAFDKASIPDGIKNVISTIVTVDFFVVLGLLAWFLAGIFFRAAFGNDAVQIAFNNNFETLVQPALGVLMIASAAGAVMKDPKEDDRGLSE